MTENPEKDHEPWPPRIEGLPLFTNSADYERSLGERSTPPDFAIPDEAAAEPDAPSLRAAVNSQTSAEGVSELAGESSEG